MSVFTLILISFLKIKAPRIHTLYLHSLVGFDHKRF
jgi:hypothetical protein